MPDSYQIESVSRAIESFEACIRQTFSVKDMADAACYSLFHFCRVFAHTTGLTPYQYMLRRRLAKAALELQQTEHNIGRIAVDYEFSSPETFARAFKRYYGMLPSEWRKSPRHHPSLLIPAIDEQLLNLIHKLKFLPESGDVTPRLWGIMSCDDGTELARLFSKITGVTEDIWYVRWYPENLPGQIYSFAGIAQKTATEGLVMLELPQGEWFAAEADAPVEDIERAITCLQHVFLANRVPISPVRFAVSSGNRTLISR